MIVFVDDEKWIVQGILDYLTDIADRLDARYQTKHFYRAYESLEFIGLNYPEIDIIISDIAMDYGDGDLNKEISGGVQFINFLKGDNVLSPIPIIILSIHSQEYFVNEMNYPIDNKSIYYVNRGENADGNILYLIIKSIFENKAK